MRITLVIFDLSGGGAERVLSVMGNYWAARGWKVSILALASSPPFYPLHPAITYQALGVDQLSRNPLDALSNNIRRIAILRHAIHSTSPDAVISFMDHSNVLTLIATAGLGVPVVVSVRNDPNFDLLTPAWRTLRRLIYARAACLVVQGENARRYFAPYVKNCRVIPNPVSAPPSTTPHRSGNVTAPDMVAMAAVFPSTLPLSPGNRHTPCVVDDNDGTRRVPTTAAGENDSNGRAGQRPQKIIAMGRLEDQKGFDLLLTAFARLAPRFPDWSLDIWGEGSKRPELEALCQQLGIEEKVRLPGRTKTPHEQYRSADIFVMSSRYEGFPNVLCEAMACGMAVLSFDCPSGPRDIIRDSVDGLLVPAENIDALTTGMERLMSNKEVRHRLAANAPEVLTRFGLQKVMTMWESVLEGVATR